MAERPAPPRLAAATAEVLRRHSPFGAMAQADLRFLAERLKLRYFAAGDVVASPSGGRVDILNIVQRGSVVGGALAGTALHSDALRLGPGECFPIGALMGERPTTLTYTAEGDTFCYQLERAGFDAVLERSKVFRDFCTRRLAHLLGESHALLAHDFASRSSEELGLATPVGETVRREPVTLPETSSVAEVLRLMKARRIGSVVLTGADGAPSGIFTHTDVLDRVALGELPLARPVSEVMTREPVSLQASASAAQAAQLMARHGFRHLLVKRGERLVGVLSERDLFAAQRRSLQGLRKEIRHAADTPGLAFAGREVRSLARSMLAQGVAAESVTQLITELNDALVERAVELASSGGELHGIEWCWIALGSEGRREQTLATDQDNAIIFLEPGEASARERLLAFAQRANVLLEAAGFPLCKGEIMARNPRWCLTLEAWRERFDDWMRNAHPEALLNAAIFFDLRSLAGDAALATRLRDFLLGNVARRPAFLRQMAANALEARPPLGMVGDFVLEEGTIDLKRLGARPFIDAARVLALAHGVAETSTPGRLAQVAPLLRMDPAESRSLIDAFQFIQSLRLRHPDRLVEGVGAPNRIDPRRLGALDARILKEALRQARKLQNRLALDYQL